VIVAKQSGIGSAAYIGGVDLSGNVTQLSKIAGGVSPLDVTTIQQSGMDRIGGRRDGGIDFTSVYDPAVEHPSLSALPTTDVQVMFAVGTAIGSPAAACVAKQINYDPTRAADGGYTIAVSTLANAYGLEWGNLLTAGIQTDTAGTNGTPVDLGTGPLSFGAQAYLQVFAVTGTSVTVKIQDSADGSTGWTDVASLVFAAATSGASPQAQRVAISNTATVRQWVRCVSSGTFSNAQYAVMVNRNMNAEVSF
jgi:hypothetical protein